MAKYQPEQGDIVFLNFNPQAGHEQAGKRPALIVSNASFHKYTRMAIVCPITNQSKNYPLHVQLDSRTRTTGEILCEHVKSLDYEARGATYVEAIPSDLLQEVLDRVKMSIE